MAWCAAQTSRIGATLRMRWRTSCSIRRLQEHLHVMLNAAWEPLVFELPTTPVGPTLVPTGRYGAGDRRRISPIRRCRCPRSNRQYPVPSALVRVL